MTRPDPAGALLALAITVIVGGCVLVAVTRWSYSEGRRRVLAVRRLTGGRR